MKKIAKGVNKIYFTMLYGNYCFIFIENFLKNSLRVDVSVNANPFCVQCSGMASAALTRDRVLQYLARQVKVYSISFHVIDIKRLFQRTRTEFSREILYRNIPLIAIQHGKFILLTTLAIFPILLGEIHSSPSGKFPNTY